MYLQQIYLILDPETGLLHMVPTNSLDKNHVDTLIKHHRFLVGILRKAASHQLFVS